MPYEVGNLQIVFNAVDDTSKAFDKLASNLKAVKKAISDIGNIGKADLNKFGKAILDVQTKFKPFLTDIKGASKGLVAFNEATKRLGITKATQVADEFKRVENAVNGASNSTKLLVDETNKGTKNLLTNAQQTTQQVTDLYSIWQKLTATGTTKLGILNQMQQTKVEIKNAEQGLAELQRKFVDIKGGAGWGWAFGYTEQAENLVSEIKNAEEEVDKLKKKLSEQQAQFGTPFNAAQSAISQLKSELLNTTFVTGQVNQELVSGIKNYQSAVEETQRIVSEALNTPLQNAQSQLMQLKNQLAETFFDKGYLDSGILQSIQELETKINGVSEAIKKNDEVERRAKLTAEELAVEDYKVAESERKKRIEFLGTLLATGQAGDKTKQYKKELKDLQKEQGNATKKQNKLLASIKRIAIYRIIRAGLSQITGSIRDSVTAYARLDSSIYNTMSSLKTSITAIKTSFGAVVLPILQAIEPVVKQIAVGFANMANVISASMSKTGQYAKINTERLLAFGDAANLLDFDKFRTLSQDDSVLEIANVEDLNEELGISKTTYEGIYFLVNSVAELLKNILELVNTIGSSSAFKTVITVISYVIGGLVKIVGRTVELLDKSGLLEPILWGIVTVLGVIGTQKVIAWLKDSSFIKWIGKLGKSLDTVKGKFALWGIAIGAVIAAIGILSNWDEFDANTKRTITIISTLIGVLTAAAVAALALSGALTMGIAVPLIITAVAAGAVAIRGMVDPEVKLMANGGSPKVGTMFWAGEAGAETVTVGNSGRTEVTNVYQMEEALYNALVRYGRENRGSDSAININIDGTRVFEATRKTANKRGLDFVRM